MSRKSLLNLSDMQVCHTEVFIIKILIIQLVLDLF